MDIKAAAWQVLLDQVLEHRSDRTCVYPEWSQLADDSFLWMMLTDTFSEGSAETPAPPSAAELEIAILTTIHARQPEWSADSVSDLLRADERSETLKSLLPAEWGLKWCEGPFKDGDYRYSFTPMGFSKNLDEATIYVELYCGSLCAQGTLYLLRRDEKGWRLVEEMMLWVS